MTHRTFNDSVLLSHLKELGDLRSELFDNNLTLSIMTSPRRETERKHILFKMRQITRAVSDDIDIAINK